MISEFIRWPRPLQQLIPFPRALLRLRGVGTTLPRWLPTKEEFSELPPASQYVVVGLTALVILVAALTLSAVITIELSAFSLPWLRPRTAASPEVANRDRKTYDHILERPVFARSRQAFAAPAEAPLPLATTVVALDQTLVLRGVFISGASAKAFLTSTQNPVGNWVHLNGEFSGWKLVNVKPEQVLLEGQGQKLVLRLSVAR